MTILLLLAIAAPALPQAPESPRQDEEPLAWSFSASTFSYFVPGDRNFTGGVAAVDRGWFHLEGRYNYEDLRTGSLFAGWNLGAGKELELKATPMLGIVQGETDAVAPAFAVAGRWKAIELYAEGEYLVDLEDASDNFFYGWAEFAVRPADWLRVGLVAERSRLFEISGEVLRGGLAGFATENFDVTVYVFDADVGDPVTVISLGFGL